MILSDSAPEFRADRDQIATQGVRQREPDPALVEWCLAQRGRLLRSDRNALAALVAASDRYWCVRMSKPDLAAKIGVSAPTIDAVFERLFRKRMIALVFANRGQTASTYRLAPDERPWGGLVPALQAERIAEQCRERLYWGTPI